MARRSDPSMIIVAIVFFASYVFAGFSLYPNGLTVSPSANSTSNTTVSVACVSAVTATIDCDPYILSLASADWFNTLNSTDLQNTLCSITCANSLRSYHDSVLSACKNDLFLWDGIPAAWAGDVVWAAHNRTCLRDSNTGQYCSDYIANISMSLSQDIDIVNLPKDELCSNCMIALMAQAQSTAYSNYNEGMVDDWQMVQTICNVTFSTEVQSNPIILFNPGSVNSSSETAICLSGNTYNVKAGGTCESIAAATNVATGTLRIINSLFPDCSNLVAGTTLCLPQSCQTYTIQTSDTCWSIATNHAIPFTTLLGYNPTINRGCTNLELGSTICISPPAGVYTPSVIPGATVTQNGPYATVAVAPPDPVASGTTSSCGTYYKAIPGDTCAKISMKASISSGLFQAINPSIGDDCTNLMAGVYYCVSPLQNWNWNSVIATSATAPILAPTSPVLALQGKGRLSDLIWAAINW